jgi:hypothetical protein
VFLENSPDPITILVYDAPDTGGGRKNISGGFRLKSSHAFVPSVRKITMISAFLISCLLPLLYPACDSKAETFKYIKIGEHETSTRIVQAAKLKYVKIGEHESYTRIVFEFKEPVRYDTPVITPGGKFAIVFFDTTTALPRQIRLDDTERVETIEFEQQESNLSANVTMPFSTFRLKSFLLVEPARLVIDVYRLEDPIDIIPGNIVLQKMMFKDTYSPVTEEDVIYEALEPEIALEKGNPGLPGEGGSKGASPIPGNTTADMADTTKEVGEFVLKEPWRGYDPVTTGLNDQAGNNTVGGQNEPAFIIEDITREGGENDRLQVYLLPILIALSFIIMVLFVFMVFQKKTGVPLPRSVKRLDSLKTNDETIAAINAKIDGKIKEIKRA